MNDSIICHTQRGDQAITDRRCSPENYERVRVREFQFFRIFWQWPGDSGQAEAFYMLIENFPC